MPVYTCFWGYNPFTKYHGHPSRWCLNHLVEKYAQVKLDRSPIPNVGVKMKNSSNHHLDDSILMYSPQNYITGCFDKWWLESDPFLLGPGNVSGANWYKSFIVSFGLMFSEIPDLFPNQTTKPPNNQQQKPRVPKQPKNQAASNSHNYCWCFRNPIPTTVWMVLKPW